MSRICGLLERGLGLRCPDGDFSSPLPDQAYADYHTMMDLTEDLIRSAAQEVTGGLQVQYQGQALDFAPPFRRASMHALVAEATGGFWLLLPSRGGAGCALRHSPADGSQSSPVAPKECARSDMGTAATFWGTSIITWCRAAFSVGCMHAAVTGPMWYFVVHSAY